MEDKTVIHIDVTPPPQNDQGSKDRRVKDFKFTPKEILLDQENYIVTGQSYSKLIHVPLFFYKKEHNLNKVND